MTVETPSPPRSVSDSLREELREAVLAELAARGLNEAATLARRLEVQAVAAHGLLHRRTWPLETALWLIDELSLPVEVSVRRT